MLCSKYEWNDELLVLHLLVHRFNSCSIVIDDILKTLSEDSILAKEFWEHIRCVIGSGSSVRLDPWVDSILFIHLFLGCLLYRGIRVP